MADYPVTIAASATSYLTDVEQMANHMNVKFTIPYSVVAVTSATTATDTVTVTLGTTPAKWFVNRALVNVTTAFAGTTALTLNVGSTSSTSAFVTAQSVLTAGVKGMASGVPVLTNANGTAAVSLVAIFTNATGGSPSALSAGSLDLYLNLVNQDDLP